MQAVHRARDHTLYETLIERLAGKPAAIEERTQDGRNDLGRIHTSTRLTFLLRSLNDRTKRIAHLRMDARLHAGKVGVALGGVDDRGENGSPRRGAQTTGNVKR